MLRVGLTGGLGSGKSTVAAMLARHGAHVLQADELGRELMQPGEAVYGAIVGHFGSGVVRPDGTLDRAELARLAFAGGRIEELNAIVHPAVIARQQELVEAIRAKEPRAVVVVESALIFETRHGSAEPGSERDWHRRFDFLILVTADEGRRIERFVVRSAGSAATEGEIAALRTEAQRRLAKQIPDAAKAPFCDTILRNDGTISELQSQVDELWPVLAAEAQARGGFEAGSIQ